LKRCCYAAWLLVLGAFALLHALHLGADFPNHSPWWMDWAKYTDEGWYGNAAVRAHLLGRWYLPGDFNPAPAAPLWAFLEWLLFYFTGVSIEAARGLAVALFFANLLLSYLLLRIAAPRWMALLAVTLLVTSPFLYCFSRLAILEPLLTTLTLAALNLAVRLPRMRRQALTAAFVGLLFTLMMLTKATAVFLLPALGWALLYPLRQRRALLWRCALMSAGASALSLGLWMALVLRAGLLPDVRYFFFTNVYLKPTQLDWPLVSLWWSLHGGLWVDPILIPLAGIVLLATLLFRRSPAARFLLLDPVFGASILAIAGTLLFMTLQDHPQPRYFAVVAFFGFFLVAQGAAALFTPPATRGPLPAAGAPTRTAPRLGWLMLGLVAIAAGINAASTLDYATHPEYTFIDAARRLTHYIDQHPNGNRILVSTSGDQIMLVTHLPAINDIFIAPESPIPDLAAKLGVYQPGWFATWNYVDRGALEDLHSHDSLEQVAAFRAFDDPERNVLILFKLHPWPDGQVYDPADQDLSHPFPEDKIEAPVR
jgi:hypothetical protein